MRRAIPALACSLVALSACSPASAAPGPSADTSVLAPMVLRSSLAIDGVGCGVPVTRSIALPARARDARVRTPRTRDQDGAARITDIALQPAAVAFSAIADGQDVCDPNADSVPPASRPWSAEFDVEVAFKRQETVAVAADWRASGGYVVRPSIVALHTYTPDTTDTVRKIRWQRYGGRKAVGFGIFKAARFFCPSPSRCIPENGQRVRVELSRPGYCAGDNVMRPGDREKPFAFYGRVSVFNTRRIGVIKPGTNFEGYEPYKHDCFGPAIPIR